MSAAQVPVSWNARSNSLHTYQHRRQCSLGARASRSMQPTSIQHLCENYKGVLLDQFGVLHDGRDPYPGAVAAVKKMHEAGMKLLLLSNSSRRGGGAIGKLSAMGFSREWFHGVLTSGELTHKYLSQRPTPFFQSLGRRCLHINWLNRGTLLVEAAMGPGWQPVEEPEDADVLVVHGTEGITLVDSTVKPLSLEEIEKLLRRSVAAGPKPMVVANPDLVTVDGQDGLAMMPGTLGQMYEAMGGGKVQLMGKPDPLMYEEALQLLRLERSQIVAIGDSLMHDIGGAQHVGVDSVFILGGIHSDDIGLDVASGIWDQQRLEELCGSHGVKPDHVMVRLRV